VPGRTVSCQVSQDLADNATKLETVTGKAGGKHHLWALRENVDDKVLVWTIREHARLERHRRTSALRKVALGKRSEHLLVFEMAIAILAIGILLAGLRWQYVASIAIILTLVLPVGWFFVLKDYQKARLVTFLDPEQDPRGSGYQVIQSKIAVGAGGLWGKGVTRGSQTQLRFLPVPHTDFIFSAFSEEHGFVGVGLMLGFYFVLLMQIVQNAQMAPDRAGMYICMGVCALLLFHILVNIGMVVGRMPVTGIPLPLMSYGGSNILSFFLMLGLVNSVRLWRFVS